MADQQGFKRINFFKGFLTTEKDWNEAEKYHIDKRMLHNRMLHAPGSDRWYIVYHRRPLGDHDRNHRVVCIDEMHFDSRGEIEPVVLTKTGVERDVLAK